MAGCICRRPPPAVDITSVFLHPSSSSVTGEENDDDELDSQLWNNLQHHGWSPVVVNLAALQDVETSPSPLARMHPTVLKRQIESLFARDVISENPPHYAIYRGRQSESGDGSSSATIEPKQSWEVSRCSLHADSDVRVQLLERWTLALHSVAMAVSRKLQWPHHLLLHDDACDLHHSPVSPCNVDLLRVFLYDRIVVAPPPNTTSRNVPMVLGSSPHSDWGSLTVVWQDDVGGLQHYCIHCRAWVDVAPAPVTPHKLQLVVHLGDAASLALGHAAAAAAAAGNLVQPQTTPQSTSTTTTTTTMKAYFSSPRPAMSSTPSWIWPSPRHRVLCSTLRNRASLVYFCYPPPGLSLQDLQDGLQNYRGLATTTNGTTPQTTSTTTTVSNPPSPPPTTFVIPYPCYSLLQNQSATSDKKMKASANHNKNATTTATAAPVHPQEVYRTILTRPLHEVFAEKWQQVQRIKAKN